MATKKILSVGFRFAFKDVEFCSVDSDRSLLDWDIAIFRPVIGGYYGSSSYRGKISLNQDSSFRLKKSSIHWRQEISLAVKNGKTVFVFLSELQDVYVDTGNREHSGTGRNQKTTIIVEPYSNYEIIPVSSVKFLGKKGSEIKVDTRHGDVLASYWKDFGDLSCYNVFLEGKDIPACLLTKHGEKPVGAIYRDASSKGSLVLLPDIRRFESISSGFVDDEKKWRPEDVQLAARILGSLLEIDKSLRNVGAMTPTPPWVSTPEYMLPQEVVLSQELLIAQRVVEDAKKSADAIVERLESSRRLKGLLYEKGVLLELAILDALKVMGFSAERFVNSDSEFDAVFSFNGHRFIGEVEGKDGKDINVDKLRQLLMNVNEDLQREEVDVPAKAVLFGNGSRLFELSKRGSQFTEKCIKSAIAQNVALVATSDLFCVVLYLLKNPDEDYAETCRRSILDGVGVVTFPPQESGVGVN